MHQQNWDGATATKSRGNRLNKLIKDCTRTYKKVRKKKWHQMRGEITKPLQFLNAMDLTQIFYYFIPINKQPILILHKRD